MTTFQVIRPAEPYLLLCAPERQSTNSTQPVSIEEFWPNFGALVCPSTSAADYSQDDLFSRLGLTQRVMSR